MDWNAYWQENRRFVLQVSLGALAFLVLRLVLGGTFERDLAAARSRVSRLERQLAEPMFDASERDRVLAVNGELRSSVERLSDAVVFRPRPGFRLEDGAGSPSNQYLRALTRVRERLLPLASRAGTTVDPGLGMPELSPTRESEIVRYLEALDVVDTFVRAAVAAGVSAIEDVRVRLDPGLSSRSGLGAGLGAVERTRVAVSVSGDSRALAALLASSQRPMEDADGPIEGGLRSPLRIDSLEMANARRARGETVRVDATFVVPRRTQAFEDAGLPSPGSTSPGSSSDATGEERR